MDFVVKSLLFFFLTITSSISAYGARHLIGSDDSGSGDRTWSVVLYSGNAQFDDYSSSTATEVKFKVGDFIRVKFERDPVEVEVVTKAEYESCKSDQPIQVLNTTDAAFKFDHPGTFYFIDAVFDDCITGQKEAIQVSP